jgi:hypothetical protein
MCGLKLQPSRRLFEELLWWISPGSGNRLGLDTCNMIKVYKYAWHVWFEAADQLNSGTDWVWFLEHNTRLICVCLCLECASEGIWCHEGLNLAFDLCEVWHGRICYDYMYIHANTRAYTHAYIRTHIHKLFTMRASSLPLIFAKYGTVGFVTNIHANTRTYTHHTHTHTYIHTQIVYHEGLSLALDLCEVWHSRIRHDYISWMFVFEPLQYMRIHVNTRARVCMCVCMHVCVYMCVYIHICECVSVVVCMSACVQTCMNMLNVRFRASATHIHVKMCVTLCVCVCKYTNVYVLVCSHECMCVHACMNMQTDVYGTNIIYVYTYPPAHIHMH